MSELETAQPESTPAAEAAAPPAPEPAPASAAAATGEGARPVPQKPAKKAPKTFTPPAALRDLPSGAEIAAWIAGEPCPKIGALLDVPLARLDALWMQIKKEELLPEHWQPFSIVDGAPDDGTFERLAEVGRLRLTYRDQELSRRRLAALKLAWKELRGKQPSLWTVSDLFAAARRLAAKSVTVDWHDLLTATRDVWAGMTVPAGRDQLDHLWIVLGFVREKSK
jgi:hypothetical protein